MSALPSVGETMTNPRPFICALATAGIVIANTGCSAAFGANYKQEVHMRVAHAPAALSVHDPVGTVTIQAWNNPYVQVDAEKKGPSEDAVNAIQVSAQPNGSELAVSADLGSNGTNRSVDFTIHAPAATNVTVNASVGKVAIDGFSRDVNVDSSVGKVTLSMAQLRKGQSVTIQSSVGAIDVSLPHDADATITASTSVGRVKGNVGFSIDRTTVGADGNAVLGSGGAQVHLNASTGSITVDRE
jgi:uncharacterized protein YaiE (UPF0345 family)